MKSRLFSFFAFSVFLFSFHPKNALSQTFDFLSFRLLPEASFPLLDSQDLYGLGGGASLALDLNVLPVISPRFEFGYEVHPTLSKSAMSMVSVGGGLSLSVFPTDRLGAALSAIGGIHQAEYQSETTADLFMKGRLELAFRLTPSFNMAATASYTRFMEGGLSLYDGVGVGLSATLNIGGLGSSADVEIKDVNFDPIFPIFYAHYDRNSLGSLKLVNNESAVIRNVRVSFFIKQFMDQPKVSAEYGAMRRGQSVEVPLYALFTDQVLKLTESTRATAEIIVDYDLLDSPRQARFSESIRVNHRNALTWDNDQKAAAFVSAKDPAVLRYSKYTAGLIRESGQNEINQNLRFAMGLFEGLKLYGLNYVIDPTTPYQELSQNKDALDFLQFPNQTLTYKGGDCDDLSILFCSILESIGIKTAFITIPGHIYMAFMLDMSEADAKATFLNAADLIFIEGATWLPLEITAINDGFLKAWQIGAKQWYDNLKIGKAEFISIETAWNEFEPVGIPGEDTRIVLPSPDDLMKAYSGSLSRFISREIQPRVEALKTDIMASGNQPKLINKLGVLYARFGMISEAKVEFEKAARSGYAPALTNLGNIFFLQKNYRDAINYYQRAVSQKAENKTALIGLARAQYELENYTEAGKAYAMVQKADPLLAGQYPYLVSRSDGVARASSAGDRSGKAAWDDE